MNHLKTMGACVITFGLLQPAFAQNYPTKPIRVIVPYAAGQGTDVATRYIAEQLAKGLGQPIVIDNKAGAGGNIGASEAARAHADGYTLVMGTNGTHVLNQFLYASMPFDPEKDFAPIGLVSTFPMVVFANPGSSYSSLSDLMADAKARPGAVNVAMPSTTARLVLELLQEKGGTKLTGVPYKGSGTAMTDVIGGQLPVGIDTASAVRSFISSGKVRALAVTSQQPSALLPQAKPATAQGLSDFQVVAWNGLYAPRGTPSAVLEKIGGELAKVMAQPDVRRRLLELGHEPAGGTAKDLADFASSERTKWGPVIKTAGLRAD